MTLLEAGILSDLVWGGVTTVIGMGTVFALLAILMVVLQCVTMLDRSDTDVSSSDEINTEKASAPETCNAHREAAMAAALAAAIHHHGQSPSPGDDKPSARYPATLPLWVGLGRINQITFWNRR